MNNNNNENQIEHKVGEMLDIIGNVDNNGCDKIGEEEGEQNNRVWYTYNPNGETSYMDYVLDAERVENMTDYVTTINQDGYYITYQNGDSINIGAQDISIIINDIEEIKMEVGSLADIASSLNERVSNLESRW
jgi:hypothetical protein